jgi:hypothetical protein
MFPDIRFYIEGLRILVYALQLLRKGDIFQKVWETLISHSCYDKKIILEKPHGYNYVKDRHSKHPQRFLQIDRLLGQNSLTRIWSGNRHYSYSRNQQTHSLRHITADAGTNDY